jgi:aldehyde dehydrogenase (NAD+)
MLTQASSAKVVSKQRQFFNTAQPRSISFKIENLKLLKQAILDNESAIEQALKADLGKPDFEVTQQK